MTDIKQRLLNAIKVELIDNFSSSKFDMQRAINYYTIIENADHYLLKELVDTIGNKGFLVRYSNYEADEYNGDDGTLQIEIMEISFEDFELYINSDEDHYWIESGDTVFEFKLNPSMYEYDMETIGIRKITEGGANIHWTGASKEIAEQWINELIDKNQKIKQDEIQSIDGKIECLSNQIKQLQDEKDKLMSN